MSGPKCLAKFLAACSLLVAVVFFLAAPAIACNAVGGGVAAGGVPAFSFQAGGYGQQFQQFQQFQQPYAQQFVQPQFLQQGCVQQFQQPVYAQQFVQPFVQQQLGYGLGLPLLFPRRALGLWPWHHHHVPVPVPVPAG